MAKKLVRHGNSLAVVVDKPLLKILGIDETSKVEITIEDGSLIITPVTSKKSSKQKKTDRIKKIAREIMDEYEDVFRKLAK